MMRYLWHIGILLSFAFSGNAKSIQASSPDVELSAKVFSPLGEETSDVSSFIVSGSVVIENWAPKNNRYCIVIPFNSPFYGENRAFLRHFEVIQPKKTRENFFGGKTQLQFENPSAIKLEQLLPEVFEIKFLDQNKSSIKIKFESHVPRLPHSDNSEWFFDGFYPHHLDKCPSEEDIKSKRESFITDIRKIKTRIEVPSGWSFFGVGKAERSGSGTSIFTSEFSAKSYVFAIGKGFKKFFFYADRVKVSAYYKTPDFEEQILTIKQAVSSFEKWFGKFPFPELVVIESSELQSSSIPGIVAFNQPKQQVFQWLQSDLLNWKHWIMVSLIGSQWYGTAISIESPEDSWLNAGIVDFVTGEVLNDFPSRLNLINTYDSGFKHFSFNYSQLQDLTAALLNQQDSKSILTNEDFISYEGINEQHPLLFVKQTQMLKFLKSVVGQATFSEFLRKTTDHFMYKKITPKNFVQFLKDERQCFSEKKTKELTAYLTDWWTKEGWADFKVKKFEKEKLDDGRWMVKAEIERNGSLRIPIKAFVVDVDDQMHPMSTDELKEETSETSNNTKFTTIIDNKPDSVEADPYRELFDADRFNNSSNYPSFKLFPGNAKTFSDKDYTILWAPYVFRRPGEPGSIGLQLVLLKYIQSSFFLNVEAAPRDKLLAFIATERAKLSFLDLRASLTAKQKYDNSRVIELALDRSPFLIKEPKFGVGLRFRNRQTLGQPKETHYSLGVGSSLSSIRKDARLNYDLNYEFERVPDGFARNFDYRRDIWILDSNLNIYKGFDFSFRAFWGKVMYAGEVPTNILFNPEDVKEARVRLDVGGLERVEELGAINNNLLLPLYLPLPGDTLILSRQLRWKIFYDYGDSQRPKNYYKAGGLGIILPFGGDFIGMGSLAITKLSLLTVLYSNVNGEVSREPRILFDMAGEL